VFSDTKSSLRFLNIDFKKSFPKIMVKYFSGDFDWKDHAEKIIDEFDELSQPPATQESDALANHAETAVLQQECWENFFQTHKTDKFFKPRRYLIEEFPELKRSENGDEEVLETKTILEVGCGYGCSILPILSENPSLRAFAGDFSPHAIHLLQVNPLYDPVRCHAWVFDAVNDPLCPEVVGEDSLDFALAVFMLSALPPHQHAGVVAKIHQALKPEALFLFRDYGLYDLTQVRSTKKLAPNLHRREDGTLAYFFSIEYVEQLFNDNGFLTVENEYCTIECRNRRKNLILKRVFIHGKFKKSTSPLLPDTPNTYVDKSLGVKETT